MNRLTIIGNLCNNPELRTTTAGVNVCQFTVAVNRRKTGDKEPEADYFRVSAWRGLADVCAKYLTKGKKVCVIGSVSVRTYQTQNGETRANMEVMAQDVEFLSSKQENVDKQSGMTKVDTKLPDEFNEPTTDDIPY